MLFRSDLIDATVRIGTLQRRLGQSGESLRTLEACVADAEAALVGDGLRSLQLAVVAHTQLATTLAGLGRSEDSRRETTRALELVERCRGRAGVDGAELDLQVARLYANLAIEWEYDTERALEFHARAQQGTGAFGDVVGGVHEGPRGRWIGELLRRSGRVRIELKKRAARILAECASKGVCTHEIGRAHV